MKRTKTITARDVYTTVVVTVSVTSLRSRDTVNSIVAGVASDAMRSLADTPRLDTTLSQIAVK
jgi:hypothetical protein